MRQWIQFLVLISLAAPNFASGQDYHLLQAQILFRRLTGVPLLTSDPRLAQMAELLKAGRSHEAASIATDDPNFLQVTVKNFAAKLGSRNETPFIPLDDFQATLIGTVADELDARLLLSGNYLYRAKNSSTVPSRRDNQHFEAIDFNHLEYKSTLVRQDTQWPGEIESHAGLMTTRGWAWNYEMGTNRRAVLYAFDRFLCKPIAAWKIPNLEEKAVARDVDRFPGKKQEVFQNQCLTCHGGLDPMRDAFARFDYLNDSLIELRQGKVAPKYSRGASKYPEGHITRSDRWFNPIAPFRPELGFKPDQTSGKGIQSFGEMIAGSDAFPACMAEKVFSSVCQREPNTKDSALLTTLANEFAKDGYNLKKLFEATASSSACLTDAGIKNFKSINQSLSVVLDVKPTTEIDRYFQETMTRLPKDGRIEEFSTTMLLAEKGLAALYCKEFSRKNPSLSQMAYSPIERPAMLGKLSNRIYGRNLTESESKRVLDAIETIGGSKGDAVFLACTIMASSVEFLVQ